MNIKYYFHILFITIFISSCTEEPVQVSQQQNPSTGISKKVEIDKDIANKDQVKKYKYEINARRDPFEPLIVVSQPILSPDNEPLTPLQSYDIEQLRLIAIILGKGPSSAMVMAPDGKGYILKKGVKVGKNNGIVLDMRNDAVLVEEKFMDFSGEMKKKTQEIRLPNREGA